MEFTIFVTSKGVQAFAGLIKPTGFVNSEFEYLLTLLPVHTTIDKAIKHTRRYPNLIQDFKSAKQKHGFSSEQDFSSMLLQEDYNDDEETESDIVELLKEQCEGHCSTEQFKATILEIKRKREMRKEQNK